MDIVCLLSVWIILIFHPVNLREEEKEHQQTAMRQRADSLNEFSKG